MILDGIQKETAQLEEKLKEAQAARTLAEVRCVGRIGPCRAKALCFVPAPFKHDSI